MQMVQLMRLHLGPEVSTNMDQLIGTLPRGAESHLAPTVPRSSRLASKVTLTHALNGFNIALGELRPWKTL